MTKYVIEERVLREVSLLEMDVLPMVEAARLLGVSVQAVSSLLDRGTLTVVVDIEARNPRRGRRLVLRSEVERRRGR